KGGFRWLQRDTRHWPPWWSRWASVEASPTLPRATARRRPRARPPPRVPPRRRTRARTARTWAMTRDRARAAPPWSTRRATSDGVWRGPLGAARATEFSCPMLRRLAPGPDAGDSLPPGGAGAVDHRFRRAEEGALHGRSHEDLAPAPVAILRLRRCILPAGRRPQLPEQRHRDARPDEGEDETERLVEELHVRAISRRRNSKLQVTRIFSDRCRRRCRGSHLPGPAPRRPMPVNGPPGTPKATTDSSCRPSV